MIGPEALQPLDDFLKSHRGLGQIFCALWPNAASPVKGACKSA
ncbi:hypothetical protein AFE_2579 [Acidithiobacillus ferrooxidans ATCC 23270]|uniref:Uncharacterized protein n=1 Tax=Acidithiobacillus ferrooxidans (strain ATCC 23270 / DSM 14882 / CIP 104768 / NCIMB 8455) TaxID=243159 RepID=B7J7P6_ACIF2|nr:hypothetical protein AFE_2579 [Acidithiobacillus ferrooxidans ATCC 23270]